MPLRYTEDPASLELVKDVPEQYIIFYSSRDADGNLWCPVSSLNRITDNGDPFLTTHLALQDCRDVEKLVEDKFTGRADSPSGLIVFVGQKPECVSF